MSDRFDDASDLKPATTEAALPTGSCKLLPSDYRGKVTAEALLEDGENNPLPAPADVPRIGCYGEPKARSR